jgi:hypothetical protein
MNWKAFLKLAIENAAYAKQLLLFLPILPPVATKALNVILDHAAKHSDCIIELADALMAEFKFGAAASEGLSPELQPVAEEINTVRQAFGEMKSSFNMEEEVVEGDSTPEEDCCKD